MTSFFTGAVAAVICCMFPFLFLGSMFNVQGPLGYFLLFGGLFSPGICGLLVAYLERNKWK